VTTNVGGPLEVLIEITPAPPPPPPPPPGEVEFDFQLAHMPLELIKSTEANVVVLMDDSGSMDWSVSAPEEREGRFRISTRGVGGVRRQASTVFAYVHALSSNTYREQSDIGRVVPTEEALAADGAFDGNQYGVWRARNHKYNRMYYNPQIQYLPWRGLDPSYREFANSAPTGALLDPMDTSATIDLTDPVNYLASKVPCIKNCRHKNVQVRDFYIPRYYTTPAEGPFLQWNDPHTLVEIRNDGSTYAGGPNRNDCAVDDGNPNTCSYAQEIQNFANWFTYFRSREYAAKNALGRATAETNTIRMGYAALNDANDRIPIRDLNVSYKAGAKRALMDQIYSIDSNGSTPLRSRLDRTGKYFECKGGNIFNLRASNPGDPECPIPASPLGQCQLSYTLVFTDGRWNGGHTPRNQDADDDTSFDGGVYGGAVQGTLADIAMDYYERDLHPTLPNEVPTTTRDRLGAPAGAFGADDATMHQHMSTYGIQLGLTGNLDDDDIPSDIGRSVDWGDPFNDWNAKTDDVRHAAMNGRGAFLTVFDTEELANSMRAVFDEFMSGKGTASAVSFNSQQIQEDSLIFRGFYNTKVNTGDVVAQEIGADGFPVEPPVWSAAAELDRKAPTDRVIVTFDGDPASPNQGEGVPFRYSQLSGEQSAQLSPEQVDYLRGDRSNERPFGQRFRERPDVQGLLGDVVNSTPIFVGPPNFAGRDRAAFPVDDGNLYSQFQEANESRRPMLLVGANDGMMHIFDADSGEEIAAYVPDKLVGGTPYANPLYQLTSATYDHNYFVDLTPAVSDVFGATRTDFQRKWRTVAVGGLRGGGKGMFALDITDPSALTSEAGAARHVLWEFTDADDVSPDPSETDLQGMPVKDLGYTYSQPTLVMTNAETGASPVRKRWAAMFGNGYNSTAGIAKLFGLFIEDGVDGWSYSAGDFVKLDTAYGAPGVGAPNQGYPNGLGTPRLVDVDANGTADLAYAGDLRGNLFRFDLRDTNPANWSVTRVFTATHDDSSCSPADAEAGICHRVLPQPITTQPIAIANPEEAEGFIVILATGSFITVPDGTNAEIQSLYGIWDRLEDAPAITKSDLVEQQLINLVDPEHGHLRTLTNARVDYSPPSTTRGWFVDFDPERPATDITGASNPDDSGNASGPQFPGERGIRNLQLRGGFLFVNTVIPRDDATCLLSPGGFQIAMNPVTGGLGGMREEIAFDLNNDGQFDDYDTVEGIMIAALRFEDAMPTDSAFIGDRRYTQLSNREITVVKTNTSVGERTGRLSWKQLAEN
ncbi:MAG: PilC/PilY family type IV pilus protein, partial [Gammaproteobacteria bacterium]